MKYDTKIILAAVGAGIVGLGSWLGIIYFAFWCAKHFGLIGG